MPRIARVVAAGVPHHIAQSSNNKQQVFFDDADRRMFLCLLGEHGEQEGVRLLGCAHLRCTQYSNLRYGHSGQWDS